MKKYLNQWVMAIVVVSVPLLSMANGSTCNEVSSQELESFFSSQNRWTEVESADSNQIAQRKVIRITINFSQIHQSTVFVGQKRMGQVNQICRRSENEIIIVSGNNQILVSRVGRDRLQSQMRILGQNYTYYYAPSSQVTGEDQEQLSEVEMDSDSESIAVF